MTKVAILSTVWLHLVVLGLLVGGTESLRIERLPAPDPASVGDHLPRVAAAPELAVEPHHGFRCGVHARETRR